jgi:hypothetical protein
LARPRASIESEKQKRLTQVFERKVKRLETTIADPCSRNAGAIGTPLTDI